MWNTLERTKVLMGDLLEGSTDTEVSGDDDLLLDEMLEKAETDLMYILKSVSILITLSYLTCL
jgi:hypothetical protein